ncbi:MULTISPECIES: PilW family protein [unclassified Pseudomonas]|uniref:PilW family protein n=1 Tax=unclassified Pseudomonas TaxID=196821 RepID=UPI002AC98CCE|nr:MULTISPECIES: PilW family protein [unclassified Pseudomonas]MEB0042449.1 prepilin-type N-terminal cleavage/methylation domain-containing protein [Pseudomonas sp. MH10]MEB0076780.1 prepilin-type N-terminal cleavage/methylation domain-containing protein [Pseudomonas sp. MH10out]MEB0101913.1 prepilin-type N-terminal cleavage/methylation domain-containing protein [Pseudomonas sp. CCI3.2]MEB0121871.1 prepilin-type N-terminal cleavage/methylation domain-containing protein [Pseudomonas sp. CCI1.2]
MNLNPKKNNIYPYQRGVSLIELMVAMTIGCFLILGITQIFITNQKSYLFQQSQLGNGENGRFALAVLGQELSKAGYRSLPTAQITNTSVSGCNFPAGVSVVAISATALCIQYEASNKADVTCQGTPLSSTNLGAIVTPYMQANPVIVEQIALDTTTNSITCTTGGITQQMVTGVADLRFDYGSSNGIGKDSSKTVTVFGPSPSNAQTIGAVRYAALMQSGSSSIRDTTDVPKALSDWNTRFSGTIADNTKIYQIVQDTIMIRNQMQ